MISIAEKRHAADPKLAFRVATAESLVAENTGEKYDAVIAFNLFHLVRDLPPTLRTIHGLLGPGGLFISKTPCMRDMKLGVVMQVVIPAAVAVGLAPSCRVFTAARFKEQVPAVGFKIVVSEYHGSGDGPLGRLLWRGGLVE